MECKVFYFQKNDIKAYNYDSYDNSINQIVSVLNNLNWDSLINEYNNTQKGNRSITQIVRTKVFRLLYSDNLCLLIICNAIFIPDLEIVLPLYFS